MCEAFSRSESLGGTRSLSPLPRTLAGQPVSRRGLMGAGSGAGALCSRPCLRGLLSRSHGDVDCPSVSWLTDSTPRIPVCVVGCMQTPPTPPQGSSAMVAGDGGQTWPSG